MVCSSPGVLPDPEATPSPAFLLHPRPLPPQHPPARLLASPPRLILLTAERASPSSILSSMPGTQEVFSRHTLSERTTRIQFPVIGLNFPEWILSSLWTGPCYPLRVGVSQALGEGYWYQKSQMVPKSEGKGLLFFFSSFPSLWGFFLKPGSNLLRKTSCVISSGLR